LYQLLSDTECVDKTLWIIKVWWDVTKLAVALSQRRATDTILARQGQVHMNYQT